MAFLELVAVKEGSSFNTGILLTKLGFLFHEINLSASNASMFNNDGFYRLELVRF